jgi:hypothetical protein
VGHNSDSGVVWSTDPEVTILTAGFVIAIDGERLAHIGRNPESDGGEPLWHVTGYRVDGPTGGWTYTDLESATVAAVEVARRTLAGRQVRQAHEADINDRKNWKPSNAPTERDEVIDAEIVDEAHPVNHEAL